nr:MAG TPA: hypothetical protein [Caudoviricetes sp.]
MHKKDTSAFLQGIHKPSRDIRSLPPEQPSQGGSCSISRANRHFSILNHNSMIKKYLSVRIIENSVR